MSHNPESSSQLQGGISLVLPCHNEAENLQAVIGEALEVLNKISDDFEIILVDDGSTDQSRAIIEQLSQEDPRLKLKVHSKNRGYGSALRTGFQSATKKWIFFTDADRQFQLREISKLIPELSRSQMVIGYRAPRKDPRHRVIYGEIFSFLIRLLFGIKARDVNCAFKIFDREIIEGEKLISSGALINAELLALAKSKGIEPIQVPVSHFPRQAGKQTGGNLRVILRASWELLRLYFHRFGN